MTVEHLPEGWELEAALRDATDLGELVRAKLSGGVLTAIDGVIALAGAAHDERVRLLACRQLIDLARELAAMELGPAEKLWQEVMASAASGQDGQK
jgi:hypothetical protein